MAALKVLAVAAASGRIGYVLMLGGRLVDWGMSNKAAEAPALAAEQIQKWINSMQPNVVVTERPEDASKKGDKTKHLIAAMANIAEHNYLLDVSVPRLQDYQNKYEEAAALAEQFPDLKPWLPKPREVQDNEPRATVLFEALSLALFVIRGPSTTLAAAMG